jgi:hypothetical protein
MILEANGVTLPAPTEITVNDEIIWSSSAGRSADGTMLGDVIANKKNISIKWGPLKASEVKKISQNIKPGFFKVKLEDEGETIQINCYRGTTTKEQIGELDDGIFWYRSVSSSMIQK